MTFHGFHTKSFNILFFRTHAECLHVELLESLCRLCGSEKLNKPRKASKHAYTLQFELLFGIQLARDDLYMHPNRICRACEQMFERFATWRQSANSTSFKTCRVLYHFEAHNSNCKLCYKSDVSKKKTRVKMIPSWSELLRFIDVFQYASADDRHTFFRELLWSSCTH